MLRAWAVAASLLLPSVAWAQDYTITVSPQELTYIGNLLSKQPYSEVSTLIQKISSQVDAQNKPPEVPKETPDAKQK